MATQVQARRGTTTQHGTFTGAAGELTVDTDKEVVVVHDGSTAGGFPVMSAGGGTFTGAVTLAAGTTSIAPLKFASGTNLTTAVAGALEYDGSFVYSTLNTTSGRGSVPSVQTFRLTGNGSNVGSAIGDFYGATSAINLVAGGVYDFLFHVYLTKNTTGTLTWTLTASSAPTLITGNYIGSPVTGIAAGTPITGYAGSQAATTAAFAATASVTNAVNMSFIIRGTVIANAASTFKLQVTNSAGTVTPLSGSFYEVRRVSTTAGSFA